MINCLPALIKKQKPNLAIYFVLSPSFYFYAVLNISLFIARRFVRGASGKRGLNSAMKITTAGMAMSIAVMLIAVSVVTGFRNQIGNKVTGFVSHVQIINYDSNRSYETIPIKKDQSFLPELYNLPGVNHIQAFVTKFGMAKTNEGVSPLVFKGIGSDFKWNFIESGLVSGSVWVPSDTERSDNILVSAQIARQLQVSTGDSVPVWFLQNPPRARKFVVSGIYETGLTEFDALFAFVDISQLQRVNQWTENQVSGFEIFIDDFRDIKQLYPEIVNTIGTYYDDEEAILDVSSITDRYSQIFDWLGMIDANVWIILILMTVVAGFNMISGLLIMILERTRTIGVFKSMGASNRMIRRIFLLQSVSVIIKGLLIGNITGLGLLFIQYSTGILTLDQKDYFLSVVPVEFNVLHIFLVNIGALTAIWLMLIVPSMIISSISPDKSIKFQ